MTKEIEEPYIELDAECLLSKWGFSDGDVLWEWWWEQYDESPTFENHDILYAMVVAFLVPEVRKAGYEVDIFRIHTIHNPVRTETLNGEEVEHSTYTSETKINPPVSVRVTKTQIEELVGKLVIKENTDGTRRSAPDRSLA